MAFIINKASYRKGKSHTLYYLVENYREKGKVKRRKLLNLHKNKSIQEYVQWLEGVVAFHLSMRGQSKNPIVQESLGKKLDSIALDREIALSSM